MAERLGELTELQDDITARRRDELIGRRLEVLVDAVGVGRSHREAPEIDGIVHVRHDLAVGEITDVTIVDALGPDLVGEGAVLPSARPRPSDGRSERARHLGQRHHRRPAAAVAGDVLGHPERPRGRWIAFALWFVLCASDGIDGYIARRHGATRSGAFLDPLADKVLVLGAMFTLVGNGVFWIVPVAIIATREFVISIYRTVVGSKGVSIPASRMAKNKTLAQQLAVGSRCCR